VRIVFLSLALAGCASQELRALEDEQDALREEYDDLEGNVAALRNAMIESGLVTEQQAMAQAPVPGKVGKGKGGKGGKGKGKEGNALPKNALDDEMAFKVSRTGDIPVLPGLVEMERTQTECGFKFTLQELQPISDFPLNKQGYGKSSPVLLLQDGVAMTPHAMPTEFGGACTGSYRHAGYVFLFSPEGRPENAEKHKYTIALDPSLPLERGEDKRPMYWVYPGTTLTFEFGRGWDPSWGAARLDLSARVAGEHISSAVVTWGENTVETDETGTLTIGQDTELPGEPFSLTIASPEDGPYVLLNTLTMGNGANALVVTSEVAFVRGSK